MVGSVRGGRPFFIGYRTSWEVLDDRVIEDPDLINFTDTGNVSRASSYFEPLWQRAVETGAFKSLPVGRACVRASAGASVLADVGIETKAPLAATGM